VTTAASVLDGTNTTTLTATVTDDKNAAGVNWSVTGGGTLSNQTTSSVTYTAPAATSAAQTITVTATSIADSSKTAVGILTVPAQLNVTTVNSGLVGAVGTAYNASLTVTGGISPYTWSVASGSTLPAGLTMTTGGVLSGAPTAAAAGNTSVQFNVKDAGTPNGLTATQTLTLSITAAPALTFTGSVPATAIFNTAYAGGSAAASGGSGTLAYSISAGLLPNGINLNAATGAITGTPTAVGTFNFTVKVADPFGDQATKAFQIVVSYPALNITTSLTLPTAYVGSNYSTALVATGGSGNSSNYTWALASGSQLPTGLTLSSSGAITGKPTSAPATTSFTATVTDSVASLSISPTFSITVSSGLGITTTTLIGGNLGVPYSATLTATGGTGSGYTWSALGNNLSAYGLSLSSSGQITGTPTQTGTVSFTAQVTDSINTATQPLSITIYTALSLPSSPGSLPTTATVGSPYLGTVTGSGGSGNYSLSVTGLSDNLSYSTAGYTITISGTPSSAATVSFNANLTDNNTGITFVMGYHITVSNAAALTLPTPNPITLPAATQGSAYTGSINASGGVSPYTWTVNSIPIPTDHTQVSIGSGLYVNNGGNSSLQVSGTPNASGPVTIAATIKDNVGTTASQSYSLTVNASGYAVTGNYYTSNECAGVSLTPTLTMTINTPTPKTATTDTNGNFSFANIPNGSYTITPSSTAPEAVFTPSTLSVTVNNGAVAAGTFGAQLGYNISGSVSYSGTQGLSNPVYVWVEGNCSSGQVGTLIPATTMTSGGGFTIHGVPMGTYTLFARMDPQGNGFPMGESFPVGQTSGVVVSGGNLSGQAIVLSDPASYAITTSPTFKVVTGTDQGVIVDFDMSTDIGTDVNGNRVIVSPNYQIEWSTTNSFTSPTSTNSFVFPATNAAGAGVVFLNNLTSGVSGSPFGNGAALYFRMRGYVSSGSSNNGPWVYFGGSSASAAVPVTIGAATGSNTISGTVTFNGTAAGPLYVGYFSSSTGVFYGQRIQNPVSPQAYSVQVPTGSGYNLVAAVDNNNDGLIDAADFTNTRGNNGPPTASVTGSASGQTVAIPTSNVTIGVTTQNNKWTSSTSTTTTYGVYFDIRYQNKVPVSAQLIGGPNVMTPVDIGRCGNCGAVQFQYDANLSSNTPTIGDTYTFALTYIDGSSEDVTAQVVGVNTAYPTALMPQQTLGVSTTPTFSWNYPSSPASYIYQFNLWSNNGTTIWRVPTSTSSSSGFTSTQVPSTSGGTGITWNVDPLGGSNTPNVPNLTSGTTYNWSITALDANGNAATRTIYFVP